jgi:predicted small secreted protein
MPVTQPCGWNPRRHGAFAWSPLLNVKGQTRRSNFTLGLAVVTSLALAACNTVSGAGRDLSSVGKAVTQTANDVKN